MKKALILIDGPNASASAKEVGFRLDYKSIHEYYRQKYDIFRSYYFTGLPPRSVDASIHKLADWLKDHDYTLISKEVKEYLQADGSVKKKGNMDVEITVYALEAYRHVDDIVFFTGDGDFRFLVETMQRAGKKVDVVSARAMCADSLRHQADVFTDMKTMKPMFERTVIAKKTLQRRYNFLNGS